VDGSRPGPVAAVLFDMDGLLIDTEPIWATARERITREHGGTWPPDAQTRMMGMSTPEWTQWMHDALGVRLSPTEIREAVLDLLERHYRDEVPSMPGAREAVARMAPRWRLAVASSSPRRLLEVVLAETGLDRHFDVFVSSEEVARGKPAPDVWLEAARRLDVDPAASVAVEDSTAGIRAAYAAGLAVIVVPDPKFPPAPDALTLAAARLDSLEQLSAGVVERARAQALT
jgi:HAD superfamily hydrolase (TIGR01509 family)